MAQGTQELMNWNFSNFQSRAVLRTPYEGAPDSACSPLERRRGLFYHEGLEGQEGIIDNMLNHEKHEIH
jgi:hypothetical protein